MKKKKVLFRNELSEIVHIDDKSIVSKDKSIWLFEIGNEITTDVAEATSILMRYQDWNNPIWEIDISDIKMDDISPERSLFWLTGGYHEWRNLEHYNRPWCDCYLDFQEEFGFLVINIVKRSKNLSDIRDGFMKYLSLPVLYDFAISEDLVRVG